jgi:two-component system, cell cycle response regulator PopA
VANVIKYIWWKMVKPKILIIGDEAARLYMQEAGYETIGLDQPPEHLAILIDMDSEQSQFAGDIISRLGDKSPTRILTFAWYENSPNREQYQKLIKMGFDGIFTNSTPIKYVNTRLESAMRIKAMAEESAIRNLSIKSFEPRRFEMENQPKKPIRVLIYGSPGPFTLQLTKILEEMGVAGIGSFSSFMAFDYLHRGNFDAIIIVARDDKAGVSAFCTGLRRNSRLYHLPCFVFANEDMDNIEDLLARGASDVNYIGIDDELAIARLLTLIDEKRRREQLAISFAMTKTAKVADSATGLYNSDFFKTHFSNSQRHFGRLKQPLCLGFLRITPNVADISTINLNAMRRILIQAGSMIGRLIRVEDSAYRFDNVDFVIMFPATDANDANVAMNRVRAVLESSAFSLGMNEAVTIIAKTYIHQVEENEGIVEIGAKVKSQL